MSRTMYDGVEQDVGFIPPTAEMVAGYIDGNPDLHYVWTDADWARFPNAVKVRVAVFSSTADGHVLDIENGDATPTEAVGWVQRRRLQGADPSVYVSWARWQETKDAFDTAGVPPPHYWIADWTGAPIVLAWSVATQYQSLTNYDISAVLDYWPGVDNAPTPTPTPTPPTEGEAMGSAITTRVDSTGKLLDVWTQGADGHLYQWVPPGTDPNGKWEVFDISAAVNAAGQTAPPLAP